MPTPLRLHLLAPLIALSVLSCRSTGADADRRPLRGDVNLISQEEITSIGAVDAFDVVERLRPRWLRVRMARSGHLDTEIVVFLDEANLGGPEMLRDIAAASIQEIRWLDSAQAGRLPGLGSRHIEGAIVVTSREPDP